MAANRFQEWQSLRSNSIICHLWQSLWLVLIFLPVGNIGKNLAGLLQPAWCVCVCVCVCSRVVLQYECGAVIPCLDFLMWQQLYCASLHKIPPYLFTPVIKWAFSAPLSVNVWHRDKDDVWITSFVLCASEAMTVGQNKISMETRLRSEKNVVKDRNQTT